MEYMPMIKIVENPGEDEENYDDDQELIRRQSTDLPVVPNESENDNDPIIVESIPIGDASPGKLVKPIEPKFQQKEECKVLEVKETSKKTKSKFDAFLEKIQNEAKKVSNLLSREKAKKQEQDKELESQENFKIDAAEWDKSVRKIHQFVQHSEDLIRTECYYCTMNGKIKGMITIKDGIIVFDPLKCEENGKVSEICKYHCYIDLKDICDAQIIKIPNETAQYVKNEKERQCYIYDYYLQIALSTTNGDSINRMLTKHENKFMKVQSYASSKKNGKSKSINISPLSFDTSSKGPEPHFSSKTQTSIQTSQYDENVFHQQSKRQAVALTFFRFSHRDKANEALTNKQQADIADNIYQNIYCMTETMTDHKYSSTMVPFFDSLIDSDQSKIDYDMELLKKKARSFDKIHEIAQKDEESITEEKPQLPKRMLSLSIPTFSPFPKHQKSNIISETQAIMIGRLLPPIIRMREWERLYSLSVDGVSMNTFLANLHGHTATILVIQDDKGWKFGAYAASDWESSRHFYGTGEAFLFTFKDTEEDINVFRWTGLNDNIQYSDENSIAMGGDKGKFALYLRKNFLYGSSHKGKTFNNEVLSCEEDFECTKFEVWGFDCY